MSYIQRLGGLVAAVGLLCLTALPACSGGGAASLFVDAEQETGSPDAGEVGFPDTSPDVWSPPELNEFHLLDLQGEAELLDEPGGAGWPCLNDTECLSGFCIQTPDGKQCSLFCDEECPFDWECVLHAASLPDQLFICAPAMMNTCRPCKKNDECSINGVDQGDRCIPYGPEGSFCGAPCGPVDCPQDYQCQAIADVVGIESDQCVRVQGECPCTQWFVEAEAETACSVENDYGTCTGSRVCTVDGLSACTASQPTAEECNGLDDNCDGQVDEEITPEPCESHNEFGSCPGFAACQDGTMDCDAPPAEPEACDGKDNDCDGETDNEFPDTDGDGVKDCMEVDKDGDGVVDNEDNCVSLPNPAQEDFDLDGMGDECDPDDDDDKVADSDDCAPLDAAVYPGAPEVCNGADDDCDGQKDEGSPDSDGDQLPDCIDEDDDNDGHVDVVDCAPLDAQMFPGAAEICDGADNDCDNSVDEDFPDSDGDGHADCVDGDQDGDGVEDGDDNCIATPNPLQEDKDQDGAGDVCDPDVDGDGIPNAVDNCAETFNPQQTDLDADGAGDDCDDDDDGDGVVDGEDNCVAVKNAGQGDADSDGQGDACDPEDDGDGILDIVDNCPVTFNPGQEDADGDGVGDACEDDTDGDLVPDADDNCPGHFNPTQEDCDQDGAGAACDHDDDDDLAPDDGDNCLCLSNPAQADLDQDGLGDDCDSDVDGDGIANGLDNCPQVFNPQQADLDDDGHGDQCDDDVDGDGVIDSADNCVGVKNPGQDDFDGDLLGDHCDDDIDGDGDPNVSDCSKYDPDIHFAAPEECDGIDNNCALGVDEGYPDADLDGFKNCVDLDDDDDGDPDETDCAPLDPWVNHGAAESCNAKDDNCDGQVDNGLGLLTCGLGNCEHTVLSCAEGQLQVCNPFEGAAPEQCDNVDNDCDGLADEDLGTTSCGLGNCLHTVANCVGGVPQVCDPMEGLELEECDGQDNDCDGFADDDLGVTTCGVGACLKTVANCVGGIPQTCDPMDGVEVEKCDGIDNDCDGEMDEELGDTTCGVGVCLHTVQNCAGGTSQVCDEWEGVGVEECDGKDNDCDGEVDNGFDEDEDGVTVCDGDCNDLDPSVFPGALELCNGLDDNCNGIVDEDQLDTDGDGQPDCTDDDDDNDGLPDDMDGWPLDPDKTEGPLGGSGSDGDVTVSETLYADLYTYPLDSPVAVSGEVLSLTDVGPELAQGDELLVWKQQQAQAGQYAFAYVLGQQQEGAVTNVSIAPPLPFAADPAQSVVLVMRVMQFDSLHVQSGGTITASAFSSGGPGGAVVFRCKTACTVGAGGQVTASALGFVGGPQVVSNSSSPYQGDSYVGAGSQGIAAANAGGGGAYPTRGDNGDSGGGGGYGAPGEWGTAYGGENVCEGGQAYGQTELSDWHLGSGGGAGSPDAEGDGSSAGNVGGKGGNGGGLVAVFAGESISVSGGVTVAGQSGNQAQSDGGEVGGGGGGSGGTILLAAPALQLDGGAVAAPGGSGGSSCWHSGCPYGGAWAGGGGAGRIRLDYNTLNGSNWPDGDQAITNPSAGYEGSLP